MAQIRLWRAAAWHTTSRDGGARSAHLLSFGAHYDADRVAVGPLVAHNDEWLPPGTGFAAHPHRDVEIVTWVVAGTLRHDDPGHGASLVSAGEAQWLDAGAGEGVLHAEANAETSPGAPPARFAQSWLRRPWDPDSVATPVATPTEPRYRRVRPDPAALAQGFTVVASGNPAHAGPEVLPLVNAGASLLVARIGATERRALASVSLALVHVVSGAVVLAGDIDVAAGDAAIVTRPDAATLEVVAVDDAEVLAWVFGP